MAKLFSRKNIEFYTYPNITIPVQIKYIDNAINIITLSRPSRIQGIIN